MWRFLLFLFLIFSSCDQGFIAERDGSSGSGGRNVNNLYSFRYAVDRGQFKYLILFEPKLPGITESRASNGGFNFKTIERQSFQFSVTKDYFIFYDQKFSKDSGNIFICRPSDKVFKVKQLPSFDFKKVYPRPNEVNVDTEVERYINEVLSLKERKKK